jgi:ParB/Sulfiredoxin domain
MSEKKSWRDIYKVHPAADVFPMLPEDELRKLGEDIKQRGLEEPIVLWSQEKGSDVYLLDGRNRMDAMELVGMETFYKTKEGGYHIQAGHHRMVNSQEHRYYIDPYTFVISKNIRRRHLTKEQQADLIVKVMKASTDLAKLAKSVKRDSNGHVQGSTKDPIKEKAVTEGKKHGISKRTMERSIAKDRGPTKKPRKKTGIAGYINGIPVPYVDGIRTLSLGASACSTTGKAVLSASKPDHLDQNAEDVIRKVLAFIDKNLSDKSYRTFSIVADRISAALGERMRKATSSGRREPRPDQLETV